MNTANPTRAPKQIGDFGEHLVTYDFIRKGYEVAHVDHVGADLICANNEKRYSVSVKSRWFKLNSKESKMFAVEKSHLKKLEYFSSIFNLEPLFSLLVCLSDEKTMFLITVRVKDLPRVFDKIKAGYSIKFSKKYRVEFESNPLVSISTWNNESIGKDIFT
jgi:hypothetical protein